MSRHLPGMLVAALIVLGGVGLGAVNYGFAVVRDLRASLPPTPDLATMPVSAAVTDRNGDLLRPFTTRDGRWRLPVTLDEVDPHFIEMLLAYEDKRFREHRGIDWRSMLRAAAQFTVAGGRIVSGGSTLTMQVARLIAGAPT